MPRLSLLARRLRLPCPQSPPSTTHPRLLSSSSPTPSGAGWASHDLLTGSCGPPAASASDSESPVVFGTEGAQEEEDERAGVLERLGRVAEVYRGPGCASSSGYFTLPGGGPGVSWGSSLFPAGEGAGDLSWAWMCHFVRKKVALALITVISCLRLPQNGKNLSMNCVDKLCIGYL